MTPSRNEVGKRGIKRSSPHRVSLAPAREMRRDWLQAALAGFDVRSQQYDNEAAQHGSIIPASPVDKIAISL